MGDVIRIISDLHYGDRASRIRGLGQLKPLLDGVRLVVVNGDAIDTREGPNPEHTHRIEREVRDFFTQFSPDTTFLTGNHDPTISSVHELELARGQLWVSHGDIVFDDIVPWGKDAPIIRRLIAELSAKAPADAGLTGRFATWRKVAASIPQRHQSERDRLKYAFRFLGDTVWPPWRAPRMLQAWAGQARLVARLAKTHRPEARFAVVGHTHYPSVRKTATGLVVINTGSYCPPLGGLLVDLEGPRLLVRNVVHAAGEFRVGKVLREFTLAVGPD